MSLAASALAVALARCAQGPQEIADGGDPLRSLGSTADSRRYDLAFWAREERKGEKLWRAAVAFCAGRPESRYVNCRNVRMAGWWGAPPVLPGVPGVQGPPGMPVLPGAAQPKGAGAGGGARDARPGTAGARPGPESRKTASGGGR